MLISQVFHGQVGDPRAMRGGVDAAPRPKKRLPFGGAATAPRRRST